MHQEILIDDSTLEDAKKSKHTISNAELRINESVANSPYVLEPNRHLHMILKDENNETKRRSWHG